MPTSDDRLVLLIDEALAALAAGPKQQRRFHRSVDAMVDLDGLDGPGVNRPERALGTRLRSLVATLLERGWEPADLAHVVRRRQDPRLVPLLAATIAAELSTPDRAPFVPPRWRSQCAALGTDIPEPASPTEAAPSGPSAAGVVEDEPVMGSGTSSAPPTVVNWRQAERLDLGTAVECALQLVAALNRLPDLEPLGPPPSRWAALPPGRAEPSDLPADPKLLTMIRALLAKAESTTFPAEAEAFAVKAQSLMTRHAIDAAVLAAATPHQLTGDVRVRRVSIDDPYGSEKAGLLHVVADLNDVRAIWDDELGLATIVGFPSDLDVVELLFTSLLVQATRAVNDPANASPDRRAPSFRRAFLLAYADRIADRLDQARQRASRDGTAEHGAALVPILAARRDAVDTLTEQLYPHTLVSRRRQVDARGWAAGRQAADRARLRP